MVQVFIVSLRVYTVRISMLEVILDVDLVSKLIIAKLALSPGKFILELLERSFIQLVIIPIR